MAYTGLALLFLIDTTLKAYFLIFMPKMKSKRSAVKRFKVTASGRLKRSKANKNHILTKKAPKRKRQLAMATYVKKADEPRIKQLLLMN